MNIKCKSGEYLFKTIDGSFSKESMYHSGGNFFVPNHCFLYRIEEVTAEKVERSKTVRPKRARQQLKQAIALVRKSSDNFVKNSVSWQDFQMCLREIEQRACV